MNWKKTLLGFTLALGLSAGHALAQAQCPLVAGQCLFFNGATGNGTSLPLDLTGYKKVSVTFSAVSTSTATLSIYQGPTATGPWQLTTAQVNDVSVGTPGCTAPCGPRTFTGPPIGFIYAEISGYAAGTITIQANVAKGP